MRVAVTIFLKGLFVNFSTLYSTLNRKLSKESVHKVWFLDNIDIHREIQTLQLSDFFTDKQISTELSFEIHHSTT